MSGGLVRLAARRVLPWPAALTALVLALCLAVPREVPAPVGELFVVIDETGRLARAGERLETWSALLTLLAPVLVACAAGLGRRWRRADADWLAALPVRPARFVAGSLAGLALAVALAVTGIALLAELRVPGGGPALRWVRTLDHPAGLLVEPDARLSWRARDLPPGLPPGSLLVLRPTVSPGSGPAASVSVAWSEATRDAGEATRVAGEATRDAGEATRESGIEARSEARIFGRSRLELALPTGARPDGIITFARHGPGAVCVLPRRAVDLYVPAGGERSIGVALALHIGLALLAWCALAAGLGAWMGAGLATGTALAGTFAALTRELPFPLPGAHLATAWSQADLGRVPPALAGETIVAAAVLLAAGAALLRAGLARGRGSA